MKVVPADTLLMADQLTSLLSRFQYIKHMVVILWGATRFQSKMKH